MKREQLGKLLKVGIITTAIMLVAEIIFSIGVVNEFFTGLITKSSSWVVYLIIWAIMFLQVTILNIPAYVVLSACISVGIKCLSWQFILIVLSAYMAGCLLAYWIGVRFGVKAVKWCAGSEEDYAKWSKMLNEKGKWWYFASVILPIFPDDLLCIVAGATKFNFKWYAVANLIGRGVGLTTMVATLGFIKMGESSFPFMVIVWAVALIGEIIAYNIIWNRK